MTFPALFDIACFGTSLTTGPTSREWQPEVQRQLQRTSSKIIRMYNLGGSGQASDWGLANLQPVINSKAKACLIEFCMNDAWTTKGISLAQSLANTTSIVSQIKAGVPGIRIFLVTTNPVIGSAVTARAALASYYAQYATVAANQGVSVIDNYAGWGSPTGTDIPDEIHPAYAAVMAKHVPGIVAALQPFV
jgi:lysophospholipase L1-like esterase